MERVMTLHQDTHCSQLSDSPSMGKFSFKNPDNFIFIVVLAAFIERIAMFFYLGSGATNGSDDVAYIQSGIEFARTGTITIWSSYPTATIMPGMPVIAGLFSRIFGEGNLYIDSVRICWILFGCGTVYIFYKCCCFFTRKWVALFGSCGFLLLNWAWSDNTFLTEPPYLFFYMLNFYFMLAMGEERSGVINKKNAFGYALSFFAALMFRANILVMPVVCAVYLFAVKKKKLSAYLFHLAVLAVTMLIFIVPWSVRNYKLFGEFIPITGGSANPLLVGTYQGRKAPKDEELDYETNVYAVIREKYPEYFNADGTLRDGVIPETVNGKIEKLKAMYRLKEWYKRDKADLIWSYLASKPASMLNWVWWWIPNMSVYAVLRAFSIANLAVCVLTISASLITGKKRGIVLFLSILYLFNIYTFAFSFASERYAAMSVPLRYFIAAIGIDFLAELISGRKRRPAAA